AAWALAARGQEGMRRVGVLMNTGADEPEAQARLAAFMQGLQEFGWAVGRNVRIDYRWMPLSPAQICGGIGCASSRGYPGGGRPDHTNATTGEAYSAHRHRPRHRSGRCGLCGESGAAERKRYWLYPVRIQFGWKMDGTAQGGRAKRRARCGAAGARRRRSRTMGHHPGRGTHDVGGVEAELSNP